MNRNVRSLVLAAVCGLAACEPASDESLVARAGDHELTVAETARLLGPRTTLPNEAQVVRSLAELWVEYTLLADATLRDSTYAGVVVDELVTQQVEGEMVFALRDSVIQPDTAISEDELRSLFAEEGAQMQVRARHILMSYPDQATQSQRDSVREEMARVLQRIRAGEDFAALARTFSQDRGSGAQGGDLGTFGPGEMVAPFEEAAFALEPGEVSGIVETPFGLHIIKVDERMVPSFEENREAFRVQVQSRLMAEAESVYVATMEAEAQPEVQDGAAALVKEVARNPGTRLSPRAADRPLVRYRGGAFTVGELQTFMLTRVPDYRAQVAGAPDQALEDNLLLPLAQRELFIEAAREAGLGASPARVDSLAGEARAGIRQAAEVMGMVGFTWPEDVTRDEAVDQLVTRILSDILDETREVIPLGPVGFSLRRSYRNEIFPAGVEAAVQRIEEIRGSPAAFAPAPTTTPPPDPDTSSTAGGGS